MSEFAYIGKRIPRVDAREKVTGEAVYGADFKLPDMLWGRIKRSPHPFARIVSIDTSRARKLSGVKAVITARDVVQFPYGAAVPDELPLADGYARFMGDEIAAVAAVDEDTAEEALDLIQIEYEELAPVLDMERAMEPGATAVHPELESIKNNVALHIEYTRGEGEKAFSRADRVFEDQFRTQAAHPCYLEPQACVAHWTTSSRVTIWGSTQGPFRVRDQVAKSLGLAEYQIRLVQSTVGGGFGGKGGKHPQRLYPIIALLARAAQKPVKMVLSRAEEFLSGRPRTSAVIRLKLGCRKDGTIVAKAVKIIADSGAYAGGAPAILRIMASRMDSLYRIANVKVDADLVYTNTLHRGPYRGLGGVQMLYALESMIDVTAAGLGLDPMELRLKNCVRQGEVSPRGWVLHSCAMDETIKLAAEKSNWKEQRKNRPYHGIGMACQVWLAGNRDWHALYDGSSAILRMNELGKVQLISGESELGQGSQTIFCQIAAEELGIPPEEIEVAPVDTEVSPFCMGTGASRVTVLGGNAVQMAAADLRKKLLEQGAEMLEARLEDLEIRGGKIGVRGSPSPELKIEEVAYQAVFKQGGLPLMGQGQYRVPDQVGRTDKNYYSNSSVAYTFSTHVAEVTVDPETGKIEVLNIWDAEDLGRALNPMACEGQIEGAILQAVGYCLNEEYIWKNGRPANPNFTDYKIPVALDIPPIHPFFIEKGNPGTPYGAKGMGESAILPTTPAIANAIYHAVGIRIRELPITPERMLAALKKRG